MAGFSVPKKKFRSSVHRHRIRRLIVEAWRLNKHLLYAEVPEGHQLHLFFIYTDTHFPEFTAMNNTVLACIKKLVPLVSVVKAIAVDE